MILGSPKKVRGYELKEQLSMGAFCISYKAEKRGNIYFFKKYNSLKDGSLRKKFIKNQQLIIRKTRDYNYCEKIIDDFEEGNDYFQVKEFIHGVDAEEYMDSIESFSEMLDILIKMAKNIEELHKRDIVHQDLKPQQFIVNTTTKETFIIDFDWSIPEGNMIKSVCTIPFKSPEHVFDRQPTKASDIFVFGMILYYFLSGYEIPFVYNCSEYDDELINLKIKNGVIGPTLKELQSFIPDSISNMVKQMLSINASDRPGINEVIKTLETKESASADEKDIMFKSTSDPNSFYLVTKDTDFDRELIKRYFKNVRDFEGDSIRYYFNKDGKAMFKIFKNNSGWQITDVLGTRNYALKNGKRISGDTLINDNDTIEIFSTTSKKTITSFIINLI